MRVLHFEFDKSFSKKIKKLAEKNGFAYTTTASYENLYEEIRSGKFQLLIINEYIRKMFDDELLRQITSAKFIYPPIIVITPEHDLTIMKKCFDLGIMACFEKEQFDSSRFTKYLQTIKKERENIELLKAFKITVVDDSPLVLDLIKEFFLFHGVERVEYYKNPEEFLQEKMDYDLFLIDFVMPQCNGDDVIAYIRRENPEGIIILVTAYNNGDILPHCLGLGADDFILKPLEFKLFMVRINSCIERYWLKRELMEKNAKLFELAIRDGFTGLYNRDYFSHACKKRGREFIRTKQPLSFVLLDIDYFKNVNDTYGHLKGDYVLKEVAEILKRETKDTDFICRWGGEEFIVMLLDTELQAATAFAEKIRKFIRQHTFKNMKPVTASFGVTQWRENDIEESVFKRLDNSLYLAKLTGRDKVVSNEEVELNYKGNPVRIEWGPFFRCGQKQLDEDHHKLIALSNEIIKICFQAEGESQTTLLFERLVEEISDHFKREEELLQAAGYENYAEHKRIHENLRKEISLVMKKFNSGGIMPEVAARYLIQEIVLGHIIKKDFDFFHLFQGV